MYENQLALEAAIMELTLVVETLDAGEPGANVQSVQAVIEENTEHIEQVQARLKSPRG
jgi:hypothetical protein